MVPLPKKWKSLEDYRKMLPNIVFEYVPHSAEKTIFKVYEEVDKQYDILLVGASGFASKVGQHYPITIDPQN